MVCSAVYYGDVGYWHQTTDDKLGNPPPRCIQEPLVVRDKEERLPRGPLGGALLLCVAVVHCRSMERDLLSLLSYTRFFWSVFIVLRHLSLGMSNCVIYSIICSYRSIGAPAIHDRAAVKLRDKLSCVALSNGYEWKAAKAVQMKKCSEGTQQRAIGCSKAEPKFFAPPQTPFLGVQYGQNLISWTWSRVTFTYRLSLVKIDARNFKLSLSQTHKDTQTGRTDYNTLCRS